MSNLKYGLKHAEILAELAAEGLTADDAADELDIPRGSARSLARRFGIKFLNKGGPGTTPGDLVSTTRGADEPVDERILSATSKRLASCKWV